VWNEANTSYRGSTPTGSIISYDSVLRFTKALISRERERSQRRGCSRKSDSPSQPVDGSLLEGFRAYLDIQFDPNFAILLGYQNISLRTVVSRRGPREFVGWMTEMEICRSKGDKTDYRSPEFVLALLRLWQRGWRWI
jgi:hypothetical protein